MQILLPGDLKFKPRKQLHNNKDKAQTTTLHQTLVVLVPIPYFYCDVNPKRRLLMVQGMIDAFYEIRDPKNKAIAQCIRILMLQNPIHHISSYKI